MNSFGYGGANVHVILEEAPDRGRNNSDSNVLKEIPDGYAVNRRKMLCLSANDPDGIERQAKVLSEYLQGHPGVEIMEDLVYTLGQRRSILKHRCAIQGDSVQGLILSLENLKYRPPKPSGLRRLAFIFTGQGAQWPKMGWELLAAYPVFKNAFQAADKHMSSLGATWSLLGTSRVMSFH